MVRKTFPRRSDNLYYNLPTVLYNAGYHLIREMGEFSLIDCKGNIVKEWQFMPSLTELFEFAEALQIT